jgi:hypothetical protein
VTARRGPVIVVLLAALAAAILVGNASASSRRELATTDVVAMPRADARSVPWFCPGAPAAVKVEDERLTLSNTGRAPVDVAVTVYPDGGGAPLTRVQTVPAASVQALRRADLGPAGPLVAEAFGPDVVVESSIEAASALAVTPCATNASDHWIFAAGATPRGVAQWLVIDDPFAADAKVDIVLRTSEGLRQPEALQGVDVARRSRAIIPIHDHAVRQELVAVEVRARVGQVVATQTVVYSDASGPRGIAVSYGAISTARAWWFADGSTADGVSDAVMLTNPGPTDAQVDLQGYPDGELALGPVTVAVPRDAVVRVPIGRCQGATAPCVPVPPGVGYALQVRADGDARVAAEIVRRAGTVQRPRGAAISAGVTAAARSWVLGRSRVANDRSSILAVTTPSATEARVSIAVVHGGVVERPAALQDVRVAPARRVAIRLDDVAELARGDAALLVTADRPVVVERVIESASETTRTPAIAVR